LACRPPHRSRRTCGAEAFDVRTRQWGPTGQFVILTSSQLGATTHRCAAELTSTPGTAARCRLVVACASCLRSGARWTVQGITMSQHQIAVIVGSVRRLRWWVSRHGAEADPANTTPDPVSVRHTPTGYASAGRRRPSALQAGGCLSGLRGAPSGRSQDGTEARSRLSDVPCTDPLSQINRGGMRPNRSDRAPRGGWVWRRGLSRSNIAIHGRRMWHLRQRQIDSTASSV